ncbi:polyprenol monophosphomannose synthase [Gemmatimonas sp.]|uniref:polyprenol monophosphomannose synthase n=1 Tax=Gemmatimonas sp. TaxID=1962908 RepID=UPI00334292BA
MQLSLVIPTYNEKDNIPLLLAELADTLVRYPDVDVEFIIVDDNSPDGSGRVADSLTAQYPLQVIHRAGKLGLGGAVMAGFQKSSRAYLGVMDADLSHDPSVLGAMFEALKGADIVVGSRFCEESRVEGRWPILRKLTSFTGVRLAQRITKISDPLSGYFLIRRDVIEGLTLTSVGYKILFEILAKGTYASVAEVPFVFRERRFSGSKLNAQEYLLFAKQLLHFTLLRRRSRLAARSKAT